MLSWNCLHLFFQEALPLLQIFQFASSKLSIRRREREKQIEEKHKIEIISFTFAFLFPVSIRKFRKWFSFVFDFNIIFSVKFHLPDVIEAKWKSRILRRISSLFFFFFCKKRFGAYNFTENLTVQTTCLWLKAKAVFLIKRFNANPLYIS